MFVLYQLYLMVIFKYKYLSYEKYHNIWHAHQRIVKSQFMFLKIWDHVI